jgi:hypothetical protein
VLGFAEPWSYKFFTPYFPARPFEIVEKMPVPDIKMQCDRLLAILNRRVIAVVDHGPGQSAKNRFDHVQELRAGRQWRQDNVWPLLYEHFPRTSLLGALMYFPIIVNICVLTYDTRFDGNRGVTMMVLASLFLLIWDYDRLKHICPISSLKQILMC